MRAFHRLLVRESEAHRRHESLFERALQRLPVQGVSRKTKRPMRRLWIFLLVALTACRFNTQVKEEKVEVDNMMRYAHNVVVSEQDYGYLMEVICPWDTTLSLGKFALVKDTTKAVGEGLTEIKVPVHSVVSFSATQWSVFLRLGEIDRVKGILEGRFVTDSTMRSLLAE